MTQFRCDFSENDYSQPAIVFDVMGFIHSFAQTNDECILGGRHNVYIELATNFFERLTECGAELVFFCDGQLQQSRINVWCNRRDSEYRETMATLSEIDAGKYRCSGKYGHRGSKYFVNGLLETAKRYGTVIVATEHDCDAMTAQYATRNNALAIVATDSDFLIYEGNWQHWHVDTLDMERFTVERFNRNALTDHLRLTREQMKVLATIAGNDYVKRGYPYRRDFQSIADFCRTLTATPNEMVYRKIAEYISNGGSNQNTIRTIEHSIGSYDINFELASDADNLELYVRENVLMHAILNDGIFQYHANYVDLSAANNNNNNVKECYLENILGSMRRLAGVLLYDKKTERGSFKLVTKHSLETKYELTHEIPEYPPCKRPIIGVSISKCSYTFLFTVEMPTLNDLIFGENDLDSTRWKLMLWTLNCKEQLRDELLRIPHQLRMVVMAIVFLRQVSAQWTYGMEVSIFIFRMILIFFIFDSI